MRYSRKPIYLFFKKLFPKRYSITRPPALIFHRSQKASTSKSSPRPKTFHFKKLPLSLLLTSVLFLIGFFTYQLINQLPLGLVTCSSQYGPCMASIQDTLDTFQHLPLAKSLSVIPQRIEHQHPGTKFGNWQYTFPKQLRLVITMPKAQYALASIDPNFQELLLVNPQGSIVGITSQSSLPHVSINQLSWNSQSQLPSSTVQAVQILSQLDQQGYSYHFPFIDQNQLQITLSQNLQVIFPLDHSSPVQLLTALHLILNRSTIDSSNISHIDLRYSKPVVK